MRWSTGDRSNVEDRRGSSGRGGLRAVPMGIGGILVLLALSWFTGVNFFSLIDPGAVPTSATVDNASPTASSPAEEKMVDFVDAVLRDAQGTWAGLLGANYQPTRAVVFRNSIDSACGFAQSATGPFYCPGDRKIYLDLGFFDELRDQFGAPGDFAQAYVLAHELGHHIQMLTGTEARARRLQQADPSQANAVSVQIELQADCYAGVWGHQAAQPGRAAKGLVELEPGDAEEALRAASSIGDDRLQRMSSGRVMPDRFTHGSSEQRMTWFRRGFDSGNPSACDTGTGR